MTIKATIQLVTLQDDGFQICRKSLGYVCIRTSGFTGGRLRLKCDGTRAETRFRLSAKLTSLFKSARASVQSTTGSRGVRISGSNAGYTMFRGSVKGTGYPLHSSVSPSLPLPCVTVCHHVSTGLYFCCGEYCAFWFYSTNLRWLYVYLTYFLFLLVQCEDSFASLLSVSLMACSFVFEHLPKY